MIANFLRTTEKLSYRGRIDRCPECDSEKIVFPKSWESKRKNEARGINWRCSDYACVGFQSDCSVAVLVAGF
jgi:hypothetical protein